MQELDFELPRDPRKIRRLTKEQRRAISRRFWSLIGGQLAQLIPLPVLLWSGLSKGILWAIPIYFLTLAVCSGISWRLLPNVRPPWQKESLILGLPFGVASLISLNPIWFQLELTFVLALALASKTVRFIRGERDALAFAPLPPEIEASRSRRIAVAFAFGSVLIAVINAYLAVEATSDAWLFFRTFALITLALASTAATMRLLIRQTRETPDA